MQDLGRDYETLASGQSLWNDTDNFEEEICDEYEEETVEELCFD
jgi:hypothetical protein